MSEPLNPFEYAIVTVLIDNHQYTLEAPLDAAGCRQAIESRLLSHLQLNDADIGHSVNQIIRLGGLPPELILPACRTAWELTNWVKVADACSMLVKNPHHRE